MAAKTNPIPSVWTRQRRARAARAQPGRDRPRGDRHAGRRRASRRSACASSAPALNAGATSLYRHVATKDELMELAVDEVVAEIAVPPADGPDWRAAATEAAGSFRATALRHPWLASVLGQAGLAYLGPNLMSVSERLAALFIGGRLPRPERRDRHRAVLRDRHEHAPRRPGSPRSPARARPRPTSSPGCCPPPSRPRPATTT